MLQIGIGGTGFASKCGGELHGSGLTGASALVFVLTKHSALGAASPTADSYRN